MAHRLWDFQDEEQASPSLPQVPVEPNLVNRVYLELKYPSQTYFFLLYLSFATVLILSAGVIDKMYNVADFESFDLWLER